MTESIRAQLTAERLAVEQRLAMLERDFDDIVGSPEGSDDEHDPEGATIAFERQHVAALITQARTQLGAVDAALARLADGTYGGCERCGHPIPADRLAARPTATTCIPCATTTR